MYCIKTRFTRLSRITHTVLDLFTLHNYRCRRDLIVKVIHAICFVNAILAPKNCVWKCTFDRFLDYNNVIFIQEKSFHKTFCGTIECNLDKRNKRLLLSIAVEYKKVANIIANVPIMNDKDKLLSSSTKNETPHDSIIELDVANVFKMLSANFIVPATIIPPSAFSN